MLSMLILSDYLEDFTQNKCNYNLSQLKSTEIRQLKSFMFGIRDLY